MFNTWMLVIVRIHLPLRNNNLPIAHFLNYGQQAKELGVNHYHMPGFLSVIMVKAYNVAEPAFLLCPPALFVLLPSKQTNV